MGSMVKITSHDYHVGETVECRYGSRSFYLATILAIDSEKNELIVVYEDETREENVKAERLRPYDGLLKQKEFGDFNSKLEQLEKVVRSSSSKKRKNTPQKKNSPEKHISKGSIKAA